MIRISNLSVPLDAADTDLRQAAAHALKQGVSSILSVKITRWSVDARDKRDVHAVISLDVEGVWSEADESRMIRRDGQIKRVDSENARPVFHGRAKPAHQPLVVGAGPAGLFAALYWAVFT
jgi:uncharacterized FAD-dependent dehydrogenase